MRRGALLVVGFALICAVPPESASARPRSLPDTLLGIISAPVDAIRSTAKRIGRSTHHRRPITHRSRPAAAANQPDRPPASILHVPIPRAAAASTAKTAAPAAAPAKASATETAAGNKAAKEVALGAEAAVSVATVGSTGTVAPAAVAAGTSAAAASAATSGATATPPVPNPAPRPRSAALALPGAGATLPSEEFQASGKGASRPARTLSGPMRDTFPLGVVGPLAWPDAYEDVVGFTLWPQKYGERLRNHGIGDVLSTLFKPAALASRTRTEMARVADTSNRSGAASVDSTGTCSGAEALPDWPTAQIERSVELTAVQRTTLDELRATIGEAVAIIKATCRDQLAMSPVERIRALQNTLWTVRDAAILIRAPLARFFDSLTDEQQKPFAISAQQPDLRAMATNGQAASRDEILRICGMSKTSEWPTRGIEQYLQPTAAQLASLENMQKKSFEMAQFLLASCLQPIPSTPTERLDAAVDRLTAVIFATSNISLALNDLYNQLSDQQKAKIISLGH